MSELTEHKPLSPMPREREDGATWIQVVELFRRHGMPEPPVRLRDEIVHFMIWGWYGEKAAEELERGTPAPSSHVRVDDEEFVQRIFDAIEDVREAPEEGISWEGWFHSQLDELSRKVSDLVDMRAASQSDGSRALPFDRETLGRFVREAWVRWARTQADPKPSWLVPYDELSEPDKEADRQIGEALARWTLIGDAARASFSPSPEPNVLPPPMRLLSEPATEFRGKRREHVTREEWETLFAPFAANVRRHMANLAAHNWHIVYDGERVGALGPNDYDGHWMFLDGSRVNMSEEEQNAFFPVAAQEMRDRNGFCTVWPARAPDGAYRKPIIRQRQIIITPSPQPREVGG